MASFAIYGLFEGDFVPHLVAIDTDNSMQDVAEAVAGHAVGRRIAHDPSATGYEAKVKGQSVALHCRFGEVVNEFGLQPLDFVVVCFAR